MFKKGCPMKRSPDYFERQAAGELALTIQDYWYEKGYKVRTFLDKMWSKDHHKRTVESWVVRSDMINGLPVNKL